MELPRCYNSSLKVYSLPKELYRMNLEEKDSIFIMVAFHHLSEMALFF